MDHELFTSLSKLGVNSVFFKYKELKACGTDGLTRYTLRHPLPCPVFTHDVLSQVQHSLLVSIISYVKKVKCKHVVIGLKTTMERDANQAVTVRCRLLIEDADKVKANMKQIEIDARAHSELLRAAMGHGERNNLLDLMELHVKQGAQIGKVMRRVFQDQRQTHTLIMNAPI